MKISHVFRTSEWLPTFPLHGHIYRALGWEQPVWVHPSIFLKPSGKGKMSKRETEVMAKSGKSIFPGDLQGMGYLPEAVINWIALMGWSYDDTEFFSMADLIEKFDINRLNPSPAAINFSKFDHFNGLHIRNLPFEDLAERLVPFFVEAGHSVTAEQLQPIVPLIQPRLVTLDDAPRIAGFFFQDSIFPDPQGLIGRKMTARDSLESLARAQGILNTLPDFELESTEPPLRALAEDLELKAGQLFGILRMAVTGQAVSPPLFESMALIGKETSLNRITRALELLKNIVAEA